jgi:hypothetical protein
MENRNKSKAVCYIILPFKFLSHVHIFKNFVDRNGQNVFALLVKGKYGATCFYTSDKCITYTKNLCKMHFCRPNNSLNQLTVHLALK